MRFTTRVIAALLALWLWIGQAAAQVPCRYEVEYIPNPPPCQFWERYVGVTGISPNGRYVCGAISDCNLGNYAVLVDTQPPGGGGTMQMTVIPRPQGVISMQAQGVNDNKELCGSMSYFLGTGGDRAFLWRNGITTDLGLPVTATDSYGNAINNKAEIAGECIIAGNPRAYRWTNGKFALLNTPANHISSGQAIDCDGRVAGYIHTQGVPNAREAFLWNGMKGFGLGFLPGGTSTWARGIGPNGVVVGLATIPVTSGLPQRAFYWRNGQIWNLGLFPGATGTSGYATNGVAIVGDASVTDGTGDGFAYASGQMRQMSKWQGDPNLVIHSPRSISMDGSIAAWGFLSGHAQGLVLRPIPAPTGDINLDCKVNVNDLLSVINAWGACTNDQPFCPADLDGNNTVNQHDLFIVLMNWGSTSQ